jgi:uncharacterized membrane protein YkvA (DUF1232 family)
MAPEKKVVNAELVQEHQDFYQRLRLRMRAWITSKAGRANRWAEYLMFAPDLFHLLCKLTMDPEVPMAHRARIAAAIAYFLSPLDLFAEVLLGPFGFIDDIALAAYVLHRLVNDTDEEIVRRHWAGEGDILQLVQRILKNADKMIGGWAMARLRGVVPK